MKPAATTVLLAFALACGREHRSTDILDAEPGARPTSARSALRPDDNDPRVAPPAFDEGDVVETHGLTGGRFLVHFTRAGRHAVPLNDANHDGVPDAVELVLATYEEIHRTFVDDWGYRPPLPDDHVPGDHGGDARFDIYLLDFAGRSDGAYRRECLSTNATTCPGYVLQENDYAGYRYATLAEAVRTLASHEYFHAVQAAYDVRHGSIVGEGTAVLATERFDASLDDFERLTHGYLSTPERTLDQEATGPVDGFAYGVALFFECISAGQASDPVRRLFEQDEASSDWLRVLDEQLASDGISLSDELLRCLQANLFTGRRATLVEGHRRAAALPEAPVEMGDGALVVEKSRVFPRSCRYFEVTGLSGDATACWTPAAGAPTDGARALTVRLLIAREGQPREIVAIPDGTPTPIHLGDGTRTFVLAAHLADDIASVPIALTVAPAGTPTPCDPTPDGGTTTPDAGPDDVGELPPPTGCDCATSPAGVVPVALAPLLRRRPRARR